MATSLLLDLLRAAQRVRRGLWQARQATYGALGRPRSRGATACASEQQLRALAAHGSDLVAILDILGTFSYVSPSHEPALGYKPAQLVGTSAFDLVHPDDRPGVVALFTEGIKERGAVRTTNLRIRHADGSWRWLEIVGNNRLFDPAVRGVIVNCRDITDRRRVEEERAQLLAREQEARAAAETAQQRFAFLAAASALLTASLDYTATLESVARLAVPFIADWCAIDLLGDDGTIRRLAVAHADPAKVELARELQRRYPLDPLGRDARSTGLPGVLRTGRSELYAEITDELLQASIHDPQQRAALRELGLTAAMIVPLMARGRSLGAITLVSAESRRRYGPDDLALAEDLARRAALAVDNARLFEAAQEAVRGRDDFVTAVSHDLKNPLLAIKGQVHLLQRLPMLRAVDTAGPAAPEKEADRPSVDSAFGGVERVSRGLAAIDAATNRMTRLINELLDVAQLRAGQPLALELQATDLVALAHAIAAEQQHATRRHGIHVEATVAALVGLWDGARLERVLLNLLANAVKYSPGGGEISLSVSQEDHWAIVAVRDQGLGIPAADLPHIFERFHRAGNVGRISGTGIGLAEARQIVEQHGGTITVASQEGCGTTFTLRLPLRHNLAPPAQG